MALPSILRLVSWSVALQLLPLVSPDDYLQTHKVHNETFCIKNNFDYVNFIFSADFQWNAPYFTFQGTKRPGCCEQRVPYQVRDDNVAEPDEILTISIARSITSASIPVEFEVQQVNVTIIDNDSK